MSRYHVIIFLLSDKEFTYAHLIRAGKKALVTTRMRLLSNPFLLGRTTRVRLYTLDAKKTMRNLAEYGDYRYVCFLNDAAVQMYADLDMHLNIARQISAAELPVEATLKQSLYLPGG